MTKEELEKRIEKKNDREAELRRIGKRLGDSYLCPKGTWDEALTDMEYLFSEISRLRVKLWKMKLYIKQIGDLDQRMIEVEATKKLLQDGFELISDIEREE